MQTGIVVGRFQVPYLHPGHLWLIATALRESDGVIVILGCQREIDDRNPFFPEQREEMIKKIFPQVRIEKIYDEASDKVWSDKLDSLIYGLAPMLYASRDSFASRYKGLVRVREVEEVPGYSGTKIREKQ